MTNRIFVFLIVLVSTTGAQVSIEAIDTLGNVGLYPSAALGADGFPIVVYRDETNGDLKVAKCGDASCSSGNTTTAVDTTGDVGEYASIEVPADGLPIISYYDATNADLKAVKCGTADCASGNTLTMVDGRPMGIMDPGTVGRYSSIAVPSDGLPVISYYDDGNTSLKVAKCGDAACSSGNTITHLDGAVQVGEYTSITVPADSLPIISYYDSRNGDLKVLKCGDPSCNSGNTITAVDTLGRAGFYTSITVAENDFPIISYYDAANWDLKVVKCGNAACTSGNTIIAVDTAGTVGLYSSIAVPQDGFPVTSYYDAVNTDLKILKCGDASCTSGSTINTVDTAGDVGSYTSLLTGADGFPFIAYYDRTNGDLKAAKCGDADCSERVSIGRPGRQTRKTGSLKKEIRLGSTWNGIVFSSGGKSYYDLQGRKIVPVKK